MLYLNKDEKLKIANAHLEILMNVEKELLFLNSQNLPNIQYQLSRLMPDLDAKRIDTLNKAGVLKDGFNENASFVNLTSIDESLMDLAIKKRVINNEIDSLLSQTE
jgi:hypothetical protein